MAASAEKKRKQATIRKRRSRERLAAMDYQAIPDTFSATEREQMLAQANTRGYDSIGEYLATLTRIDGMRIEHDHKHIGTCPDCRLPLPKGCGGVFEKQTKCHYLQGLPLVEVVINK
jgi:hypothetical protein